MASGDEDSRAPILRVDDLAIAFENRAVEVPVVRGIGFRLHRGEVLAMVGESGSGKSATALALLDLLPRPPARILRGTAVFEGMDLLADGGRHARAVRGRRIAMVFQDPLTALNPFLTVGAQVAEAVRIGTGLRRRKADERCLALLEEAGLPDPRRVASSHPHELSGGQRQRALIAMSLAGDPSLLIADEPTTALDVTVQAQILDLFRRLVRERRMALLLITHDLGVVAGIADRVAVLYAGRIAECAPAEAVFRRPEHPYTRGLLASAPRLDADPALDLPSIPGAPPDPASLAGGCAFAPRCPHREARCDREDPPVRLLRPFHEAACHVPQGASARSPAGIGT